MKLRTSYEAARNGRPARWSVDDCEAARLQAWQTARPWGVTGSTPEQVWSQREPITAELRQRFHNAVAFFQEDERKKKGWLPGIALAPTVEASINRVAIRLCGCGTAAAPSVPAVRTAEGANCSTIFVLKLGKHFGGGASFLNPVPYKGEAFKKLCCTKLGKTVAEAEQEADSRWQKILKGLLE